MTTTTAPTPPCPPNLHYNTHYHNAPPNNCIIQPQNHHRHIRKHPLPRPLSLLSLFIAMLRKRNSSSQPTSSAENNDKMPPAATGSWSLRTQWMFFAVASGACAAFNGVFAKLYVFFCISFISTSYYVSWYTNYDQYYYRSHYYSI